MELLNLLKLNGGKDDVNILVFRNSGRFKDTFTYYNYKSSESGNRFIVIEGYVSISQTKRWTK